MSAALADKPDLLNSCKELREVCRAVFRFISMVDAANKNDMLSGALANEINALGIQPGFASRAEDAIFEEELSRKASN